MNIKELQKKITSIPEEVLSIMPKEEQAVFKNFKFFPTQLLIKADWNYKEEDEDMAKYLLNNIKRKGQIVTCQVRKLKTGYYEVVDGNHRLDVFNTLKKEFVMAYDHGNITVAEAQRESINVNNIMFPTDNIKLSKIIKEMSETFSEKDFKNSLPYTEEELENFIKLVDFDWSQFEGGEPPEAPEEKKHKCPECGHEFTD